MKKGEALWNARARLARALEDHDRYGPNTYGRRDAIHKHIPDAIEELVQVKFEALVRAAAEMPKMPETVEIKGLKEFGPHD